MATSIDHLGLDRAVAEYALVQGSREEVHHDDMESYEERVMNGVRRQVELSAESSQSSESDVPVRESRTKARVKKHSRTREKSAKHAAKRKRRHKRGRSRTSRRRRSRTPRRSEVIDDKAIKAMDTKEASKVSGTVMKKTRQRRRRRGARARTPEKRNTLQLSMIAKAVEQKRVPRVMHHTLPAVLTHPSSSSSPSPSSSSPSSPSYPPVEDLDQTAHLGDETAVALTRSMKHVEETRKELVQLDNVVAHVEDVLQRARSAMQGAPVPHGGAAQQVAYLEQMLVRVQAEYHRLTQHLMSLRTFAEDVVPELQRAESFGRLLHDNDSFERILVETAPNHFRALHVSPFQAADPFTAPELREQIHSFATVHLDDLHPNFEAHVDALHERVANVLLEAHMRHRQAQFDAFRGHEVSAEREVRYVCILADEFLTPTRQPTPDVPQVSMLQQIAAGKAVALSPRGARPALKASVVASGSASASPRGNGARRKGVKRPERGQMVKFDSSSDDEIPAPKHSSGDETATDHDPLPTELDLALRRSESNVQLAEAIEEARVQKAQRTEEEARRELQRFKKQKSIKVPEEQVLLLEQQRREKEAALGVRQVTGKKQPKLNEKKWLKQKQREIKINNKHFEMTCDMMLGIRSVVKEVSQLFGERMHLPPTGHEFEYTRTITFPTEGSATTSPHPHRTFDFKDYAGPIFARIRARAGISDEEYFASIACDLPYLDFISNSKSGMFFFFSHDEKFMIKSQPKGEAKFFRSVLKEYFQHLEKNPDSMLIKVFGIHRVSLKNREVHFMIMQNLFSTGGKPIHERFDLKGSTDGRFATAAERMQKTPVLKDLDFRDTFLKLGSKRDLFLSTLRKDAEFLAEHSLMDYSLLLGVHYERRADAGDEDSNVVTVSDSELPVPHSRGGARPARGRGAGGHGPPPYRRSRSMSMMSVPQSPDSGDPLGSRGAATLPSRFRHLGDGQQLHPPQEEQEEERRGPTAPLSPMSPMSIVVSEVPSEPGSPARGGALSPTRGGMPEDLPRRAMRRKPSMYGLSKHQTPAVRMANPLVNQYFEQWLRESRHELSHMAPRMPPMKRARKLVSRDGGIRSDPMIEDPDKGPEIYFCGIIDFLQVYNAKKKAEHFLKSTFMRKDPYKISAVKPRVYMKRFIEFIEAHTL